MFSRNFREHGNTKLSTYMITYKVGDLVDIKANGSIHKGMPHKYYHGRTAVVYNVSPRALGLIVNKRVGNRYMEKRINVRIEHVKPSKSRADFLRRVQENAAASAAAKAQGLPAPVLKRLPAGPRPAHMVSMLNNEPVTVTPIPYEQLI
jgi:large subunit ribosomal protein L21e